MYFNFVKWIKYKVEINELDGIIDDLRCLVLGLFEKVLKYIVYNVNGFKFRIVEREVNLKKKIVVFMWLLRL